MNINIINRLIKELNKNNFNFRKLTESLNDEEINDIEKNFEDLDEAYKIPIANLLESTNKFEDGVFSENNQYKFKEYLKEDTSPVNMTLPKISELELYKMANKATNNDLENRIVDLLTKGKLLTQEDLEEHLVIMKSYKFHAKDIIMELYNKGTIKLKINSPKKIQLNPYVLVVPIQEATGTISYVNMSNLMYFNNKMELSKTSTINVFMSMCFGYIFIRMYNKFKDLKYNYKFLEDGAMCYAKLVCTIFSRLCNLNLVKEDYNDVIYLSAKFFLRYLCKNTVDVANEKIAMKLSSITEDRVQKYAGINFENLFEFYDGMIKEVPSLAKTNTRDFINQWIKMYGTNSLFAIEYLPAFGCMMYATSLKVYLMNVIAIQNATGKTGDIFANDVISL